MGLLLVLAVVALLYVLLKRFVWYRPDRRGTVRNAPAPGPVATLGLGLLRGFCGGKRSGVLEGPVASVVLVNDVTLRPAALAAYHANTLLSGGRAEAGAAATRTTLPMCYPQVLVTPLSAGLVVDQGFPLAPLGVVHLRQTMTQFRRMPASGEYQTRVSFQAYPGGLLYLETERGIELTLHIELSERSRPDQKVWQGDCVFLSRGSAPARRAGAAPTFTPPVWDVSSLHNVSDRTGLQYAAVSGDYNPIHLYRWSALPMGFSRPIAHGMWTVSAALNELEALGGVRPDVFPLTVDCEFKRPLLMPAKVTFGFRRRQSEGDVMMGIYDKNNVEAHMIAYVKQ